MRVYGIVLAFLAALLLFSGCGNNNEGSNPIAPIVTSMGLANVTFKIVGGEESALRANTEETEAEVTFTFKILRTNSPNDCDTIKKISRVTNGQAEFSFYALPAGVAIANIEISNGRIGEYSRFRGAQTLKPGENNVFLISGVGSKYTPDLVAGALESLLTGKKINVATTENLILDLIDAIDETLEKAEPNDAGLVENIAEVYLCSKSQALQENIKNLYNNHLMHFLMTITTSGQNAYNKASSYYGWAWEEGLFWTYFTGDLKLNTLQTFAFIDSNFNSYKTKTSSANINGFKYGLSYKIDAMTGLLEGSQTYFYTAQADGNYDVYGRYKAYLVGEQILQITPSKLIVSMSQPYPIGGSADIDMGTNGKLTVNFNGSCVADASYTDSLNQTIATRLFLEKCSILNHSYILELSNNQIRANSLPANSKTLAEIEAEFQKLVKRK